MYLPVLKPSFWIYIYFFFTDGERYFSIFISHLYILNSMNSQKKNKDMGEDMCACACVIDMLVSMCWCQRRYQVSCSITVCFVPLVNRFITEPGVVLVASKPHWSFSLYLYIDLGLQMRVTIPSFWYMFCGFEYSTQCLPSEPSPQPPSGTFSQACTILQSMGSVFLKLFSVSLYMVAFNLKNTTKKSLTFITSGCHWACFKSC